MIACYGKDAHCTRFSHVFYDCCCFPNARIYWQVLWPVNMKLGVLCRIFRPSSCVRLQSARKKAVSNKIEICCSISFPLFNFAWLPKIVLLWLNFPFRCLHHQQRDLFVRNPKNWFDLIDDSASWPLATHWNSRFSKIHCPCFTKFEGMPFRWHFLWSLQLCTREPWLRVSTAIGWNARNLRASCTWNDIQRLSLWD